MSKLPFNHPLAVEFDTAHKRFKEASRVWYRIRMTVGPLADALPQNRFVYYEAKQKYSDEAKLYADARAHFQREITLLYTKSTSVENSQLEFSKPVSNLLGLSGEPIHGDKKIIDQMDAERAYEADPAVQALKAMFAQKKEAGEALRITNNDLESYSDLARKSEVDSAKLTASLSINEEIPVLEDIENVTE